MKNDAAKGSGNDEKKPGRPKGSIKAENMTYTSLPWPDKTRKQFDHLMIDLGITSRHILIQKLLDYGADGLRKQHEDAG